MENDNKKKSAGYLVTSIAGLLLGFFGVFVSVFSDGSSYEQIITILIVLIIYGILGIVIGLWKPIKTFVYLPWLSLPGVLILLVNMYREFNILYVLYMILIVSVSYLGLNSGRSLKRRKK